LSGSGFSAGEGACASGNGFWHEAQSTAKYHLPGSVNFLLDPVKVIIMTSTVAKNYVINNNGLYCIVKVKARKVLLRAA
jgi:hypothetical protein